MGSLKNRCMSFKLDRTWLDSVLGKHTGQNFKIRNNNNLRSSNNISITNLIKMDFIGALKGYVSQKERWGYWIYHFLMQVPFWLSTPSTDIWECFSFHAFHVANFDSLLICFPVLFSTFIRLKAFILFLGLNRLYL